MGLQPLLLDEGRLIICFFVPAHEVVVFVFVLVLVLVGMAQLRDCAVLQAASMLNSRDFPGRFVAALPAGQGECDPLLARRGRRGRRGGRRGCFLAVLALLALRSHDLGTGVLCVFCQIIRGSLFDHVTLHVVRKHLRVSFGLLHQKHQVLVHRL